MTQTQTQSGYVPKVVKESPLGLLIAVVRDDPDAGKDTLAARFRALVLKEDYYEFLEALIAEWVSIKFSTAMRAACPPSAEELRQKAADRRNAGRRVSSMVEKAKDLIGSRFLEYVMPNGKRLRDCTGAECKQFGGLFAHIGRRVGNKRVVGDVLTTEQVTYLVHKYSPAD